MVYLVIIEGTPAGVARAKGQIRNLSNGIINIAENVVLFGSVHGAAELRNFLGATDVRLCIAQLSGTWAAHGMPGVSGWLRAAKSIF